MGASSLLLQIVCLRQLLSVFSGNELIIGITIGGWLVLVALGSLAGSRVRYDVAFGLSFLCIGLLSQPTVILIRSIRSFASIESGEIIPLPSTILWTVISIAAICMVIGAQFPLAVRHLRERLAEVYGLEAIGAFMAGGLFTLLVSGRVETHTLVMTLAIINILASALMLRGRWPLFLVIIPIAIYMIRGWFTTPGYRGLEFINAVESRYGEIAVFRIRGQYNIYYSGKYLYSYPDTQTEELKAHLPILVVNGKTTIKNTQTEELKAHLPMTLASDIKDILIVGGSPAIIREFLKYPVSGVEFVEIDPLLVKVAEGLLSDRDRGYLDDRRVRMIYMDARRYIKSSAPSRYDLVLLNIAEPSTANINRFYTVEFFKEVRSILRKDGLLYLSLPTSSGYIGRGMQKANGSVYASLREVFPYVVNSSEEYGIIIGSMSPVDVSPEVLIDRFQDAGITTSFFRPYILRDAFMPLKVEMVRMRLSGVREINTDHRPISYLYNLILWSEAHGGVWLRPLLGNKVLVFLLPLALILAMIFILRGEGPFYAIFTSGYFTMAFTLILILTYQSRFGYIYEAIGILSGTFMLGGAAGAYLMRHRADPLNWLRGLDVSSILLLFIAMALMDKEWSFYIFIFLAGLIGGGEFALAGSVYRERGDSGLSGRLYAIDLAGSFPGSFITTVSMLPVAGMVSTILFLIFMKLTSFISLMIYRRA
jgi:spermidine synthase